MSDRPRVRLRQAVLVAADLAPVEATLRKELGLGEPFRDPGVAAFGLVNGVFALGDCFLEVISPTQDDTAAGRYLQSHGAGGYMAIFDLEDLEGARARAQRLGVRAVWGIDLPDISTTHLHPADMRGAIVSIDQSRPPGSWRWGGPAWTGQTGHGAPGHLAGITVAVDDPAAVAGRWGEVLGVSSRVGSDSEPVLDLDEASVRFVAAGESHGNGLTEIAVQVPAEQRRERSAVEIGGVRFLLQDPV